ncbi:hypothetical protein ACP275_04G223700 [Erythranthe tilingii]
MEMNKHKANSVAQNSRKRKRKEQGIGKHNDSGGIEKLPDDMLIAILSCMRLKDAVKTSIFSRRWRYLWRFTSGKLVFVDREMETENFKSWVNHILQLHRGRPVDSLIIRFINLVLGPQSSDIDSWVFSAIHKDVKKFELNLKRVEFNLPVQNYEFPNIDKLLSFKYPFVSLKSLILVHVDIEDEVVQYFLASCIYIECLCIRGSNATKNLQVVDPLPNLKKLEVSDCSNIQSMEINAMNLVTCTYQGSKINSPFVKTPNLRELTLGGLFCKSFIFKPNKHSSYSATLVKLVLNLNTRVRKRTNSSPDLPQLHSLKRLDLNAVAKIGRGLLFFISLIKASPNLLEFRIELKYTTPDPLRLKMPYPSVTWQQARGGFCHKKLKVVEMISFIGYEEERDLLDKIAEIAPSIEKVLIDTRNTHRRDHKLPNSITEEVRKQMKSNARSSTESHAMVMACRFPLETKVVVK